MDPKTENEKNDDFDIKRIPMPKHKGRLREFWEIFKINRLALAGLSFFTLFFLLAILGSIATKGEKPAFDPTTVRLADKLKPPLANSNAEAVGQSLVPRFGLYILGTDELGRDIFSRMLQGAMISLEVGFISVSISVLLGIFIGGIAGYYGETKLFGFISVDTLIVGLIDIQLSFPTFFLILTVVAVLPPSIWNIMIVIGITGWVGPARFVRAELLSLKQQDFIMAARMTGMSDFRIIFKHLIPNALASVFVLATIGVADAILTESSLSFLGFGVPPPHATWGNILADGQNYIFDAPWLTYVPGIAILVTVLSFNLLGEGLRDALNPKLRGE